MKNTCNIVRDLMPLYVDDMLSEESKQLVDEHMATCKACQEEYRTMSAEVQIPMNLNANPMKKVKRTIVKRVALIIASIVLLCGAFFLANIILIPIDYEKYDLANTLKVVAKEDGLYLVCMGGTSVSTYIYVLPESEETQEIREDGKTYVDYYVYIESALINQLHIVGYQKEHYMTELESEDTLFATYKRISKAEDENIVPHHLYYGNVWNDETHLIWENPDVE